MNAYIYCPKGKNVAADYRNGGYKRYHSTPANKNKMQFSQSKMTINGKEKIYKVSH